MSVGNTPSSRNPSVNDRRGVAGRQLAHPLRRLRLCPHQVRMDHCGDEQHEHRDVKRAVRGSDRESSPSRKAAESDRHRSEVARKTAVSICGPAIITNAIGRR